MNSNKGFTLIEIIISVTLLSIFTIPVIMTFFQSQSNYNASIKLYEASLLAQNINIEIRAAFNSMDNFAELLDKDNITPLYKITCLSENEFDKRFKTDTYNTDVFIIPIEDADKPAEYIFTTKNNRQKEQKEISYISDFTLAHQITYDIYADKALVISYDDGFETLKNTGVSVTQGNDSCRIRFDSQAADVHALVEVHNIENEITITAENNSGKNVYLTIKRNYADKDKIKLKTDNNIFANIFPHDKEKYIIFSEIYGTDNKLLIRFVDIL